MGRLRTGLTPKRRAARRAPFRTPLVLRRHTPSGSSRPVGNRLDQSTWVVPKVDILRSALAETIKALTDRSIRAVYAPCSHGHKPGNPGSV